MKNLRLLSLAGLFVICCTENVSSTSQAVQQPNEVVLQTGEPDQQADEFVQEITNAALAEDNTQIQQLLDANPDYSIDQQNSVGRTPLHALISKPNVRSSYVVALLKFDPELLVRDAGGKTPLDLAAAIQRDQSILELLVTKILVERLTPPGEASHPEPNATLKDYLAVLENRLREVFTHPINHQRLPELQDLEANFNSSLRQSMPRENTTRKEFSKFLRVCLHINNHRITEEDLGNFDIELYFEMPMLQRIIGKNNLLQLAGDRENTRLVRCICNRIYTPWTLRRLSRAADAKWGDPMYETLQHNDEIKRTINTRYWSQLSDVLKTVGLVITGTIGAYLGFLIRQIHHQLSR